MRRTLGTAVFSGMLGVTFFGIFLTPVFFYVIDRVAPSRLFTDWPAGHAQPGRSDRSATLVVYPRPCEAKLRGTRKRRATGSVAGWCGELRPCAAVTHATTRPRIAPTRQEWNGAFVAETPTAISTIRAPRRSADCITDCRQPTPATDD